MKFYEYDAEGWLIGWYEAETPRPNSTQILPLSPVSQSRWVNGAWTLDPSREQQREADEQAERTKRQQAIDVLKAFNSNTATLAQTRTAVAAQTLLLRGIIQELQ